MCSVDLEFDLNHALQLGTLPIAVGKIEVLYSSNVVVEGSGCCSSRWLTIFDLLIGTSPIMPYVKTCIDFCTRADLCK